MDQGKAGEEINMDLGSGDESKDVLLQEIERPERQQGRRQNSNPPVQGSRQEPFDPSNDPYQQHRSRPQHPHRYAGRADSQMGSKYDDEPCCGISLLKYVLFIFNFLLLLAGAGVLAIGIWTLISKSDYTQLLCSQIYFISFIALIVAGCLLIILAATGCYGSVQEVKGCLLLYFTLLLLLCIIEIGLGIFLYIFKVQLQTELEGCLNETLTMQYGKETQVAFTETFDEMQRSFKCCGSTDYMDWSVSYWNSSGQAKNRTTPDSCCKTESNFCAVRSHPSNINRHGCVQSLALYLSDHLVLIIVVFLGIGLVEMVGLVFTMCLYCHLRYEAEDL